MTALISDFLTIILPAFSGGALVIFLAKNWFLERLKGSIKNEYDQELERLRAELSSRNAKEIETIKATLTRDAEVIAAAQKSFLDSHGTVHPHKIEAIKELWGALLHVQRNSPSAFTLMDILIASEYGSNLGTHVMKNFSDISMDDIGKMASGKVAKIQDHRILAGEYLWSLFTAYQAISMRIAFLFKQGREKGHVSPWYEDAGCRSIIKSVCSPAELIDFDSQKTAKIIWIRNLIESKFLIAANRILDGKASVDMALEEAKRIALAVSAVKFVS